MSRLSSNDMVFRVSSAGFMSTCGVISTRKSLRPNPFIGARVGHYCSNYMLDLNVLGKAAYASSDKLGRFISYQCVSVMLVKVKSS